MIAKSWRSNWTRVIPFFAHPPEIRKVIYTTNAIESLNMSLRKVTKARGSFPNDEAVFKLLYLALRNIAKRWTMALHDWKAALNRFAIIYDNLLQYVKDRLVYQTGNTRSLEINDARESTDPTISAFANGLTEPFRIVDLRSATFGSGLDLWRSHCDTVVRRCGPELIFAIEYR